ncbi:MAG: RNA polymerase sigma factor [Chloroflexota bacterium]
MSVAVDHTSDCRTAWATQDDAVLVTAGRADPAAFGALYERYVRPIYRYCVHQLGSREVAEDATGEVFLRALAALDSYRGGWLRPGCSVSPRTSSSMYAGAAKSVPIEVACEPVDPEPGPEHQPMAGTGEPAGGSGDGARVAAGGLVRRADP